MRCSPGRCAYRRIILTLLLGLPSGACSDARDPTSPDARYVEARWSEPASWPSGAVPRTGSDVEIPAGTSMHLDVAPPALNRLTVRGRLVLDDVADRELVARSIVVVGALQVGTERRPYAHRAVITLTDATAGSAYAVGPGGDAGDGKRLAVAGGALDLHGRARTTWTHLGATADAGARTLVLDRPVDWQSGDRIAIASTEFDPLAAEEAVVRSASGATVTLDEPLHRRHWGRLQTIAGATVDERAEVALLSRNIVVRGDSASVRGSGGHVLIMAGGVARIENVEFYRMGQAGQLGRYPLHWHLVGNAAGQYARGNAIHSTYNRCLTVHGTNALDVRDNVCFDNLGHAFFLEDGSEQGNILVGNLGFATRAPAVAARLLQSDSTPATFWISNPSNALRDNAAAGSTGMGFWYALPEHPTGFTANGAVWPRRLPLREFSGNVAHSNTHSGLHVDDGPTPTGGTELASYEPRQRAAADALPEPAYFRAFGAYKNAGHGAWMRGAALHLDDARLADNAVGVTLAGSEGFVQNSLIVGETANNARASLDPLRGFEFYDGPVGAEHVTFANFRSGSLRRASALGFRRRNPVPASTQSFARSLLFVDADPVYVDEPDPASDGDKFALFRDLDGSVTGEAGVYVTANSAALVTDVCRKRAEWNAYVCYEEYLQLAATAPGASALAPAELQRDDGVTAVLAGVPGDPSSVTGVVVVGHAYTLRTAGEVPRVLQVSIGRARAGGNGPIEIYPRIASPAATATPPVGLTPIAPSQAAPRGPQVVPVSMLLQLPYPDPPSAVTMDNDPRALLPASGYVELVNTPASGFYYDAAARTLYLKTAVRNGGSPTSVSITRR